MSTAILSTDCTSFTIFPGSGSGPNFKELENYYEKLEEKFQDFRVPETLGRPREEALQSLREIYRECSEEGWDGYDALPITGSAYVEAKRLIESLPLTSFFPMPEVVPEPNGEIGLEWYRKSRLVFIASVSGRNEIVYAGLFGANKTHGTEYFGDSLPSVILENLKRLYRD